MLDRYHQNCFVCHNIKQVWFVYFAAAGRVIEVRRSPKSVIDWAEVVFASDFLSVGLSKGWREELFECVACWRSRRCAVWRCKERKMTRILPPARIMVLLHLWVPLSLYVIPKWASQELEGREDYCLIFSKVNILNGHRQAGPYLISPYGKTLYSHMVGWNYPVYLHSAIMIDWVNRRWKGDWKRAIEKSSPRKVARDLSVIPAFGGLTLDSHGIWVMALVLSHLIRLNWAKLVVDSPWEDFRDMVFCFGARNSTGFDARGGWLWKEVAIIATGWLAVFSSRKNF